MYISEVNGANEEPRQLLLLYFVDRASCNDSW